MVEPDSSKSPGPVGADEIGRLCYMVGELTGKVELLVGKISETMTSLVTERARIDSVDRRLSAFSIIGPALTVLVPAIISVGLALAMRPSSDRGLSTLELERLRSELRQLRATERTGGVDGHFQFQPRAGEGRSEKRSVQLGD